MHWATVYAANLGQREADAASAAEEPVRERDDRVEVPPRHRAEHEDQHRQTERGGGAVLQQLQPHVVRGQLLRGDSRADHDGDQQAGAQELGEQPPDQRGRRPIHGRHLD